MARATFCSASINDVVLAGWLAGAHSARRSSFSGASAASHHLHILPTASMDMPRHLLRRHAMWACARACARACACACMAELPLPPFSTLAAVRVYACIHLMASIQQLPSPAVWYLQPCFQLP